MIFDYVYIKIAHSIKNVNSVYVFIRGFKTEYFIFIAILTFL
jgi:hypothetical protein